MMSSEIFQLPAQTKNHFTSIDEIDSNSYNIPLDSTFAGVDAILPSLGLLFQVTVSDQHPVKAVSLERLESCFQIMSRRTSNPVKFVFVTDNRQFPEYKFQSYYDTHGHTLKTPAKKRIPWIEQWLWQFDFEGLKMMKRKREPDMQQPPEDHLPKRRSTRISGVATNPFH